MKNHTMLVLYDSSFAAFVKDLDIGCILVGDSAKQVVEGDLTTLKASMTNMVQYTTNVKNGLGKSNIDIVGDMPIDSYNNPEDALKNARLLLSAGADIIKIECPYKFLSDRILVIRHLRKNDIRVMGHIGYLPQTAKSSKYVGVNYEEIIGLVKSASQLEDAGVESIVVEHVFHEPAMLIADLIKIPLIHIAGSGPAKGRKNIFQAMNVYDALGLSTLSRNPKIKWMPPVEGNGAKAISNWIASVKNKEYPNEKQYSKLIDKIGADATRQIMDAVVWDLTYHNSPVSEGLIWADSKSPYKEPASSYIIEPVKKLIKEGNLTTSSKVAESCCGEARNLCALGLELGMTNLIGTDISPAAIRRAKNYLIKKKVSANLFVSDVMNLQVSDLNLLIYDMSNVHQKFPKKIVEEAHRALLPGGYFLFETTSIKDPMFKGKKEFTDQGTYFHLYEEDDVKELLKDFQILDLRHTKVVHTNDHGEGYPDRHQTHEHRGICVLARKR